MTTSLAQLIALLSDEEQPLPVNRLPDLSDLDPLQMDVLQDAWSGIPASRRRSLLSELRQLADLHVEYSFDSINRLAMDDPDPEIRRMAIENLWECEDANLAQRLLDILRSDQEHRVRGASASALAPFVYLCEVSDPDVIMMAEIEDALLHASQNDPEIHVRLRALEALGHSSRAEIPGLIQQAYDVGDDDHKSAALLAMGRSVSSDWSEIIMSEFHNPSPDLRAQAAIAAGQIELRASLPELIELLDDVSSAVRMASIWSLGQLGGSKAIDALSELLETTENVDEADLVNEALDHAIFMESTRDLVIGDSNPDEGSII